VKRLRRLLRERSLRTAEQCFVVEGPTLIAEAVAARWEIEAQFVGPGGEPVDGAGEVFRVDEGVCERVATTVTPRPVLAVVRMRAPVSVEVCAPTPGEPAPFVLVLAGVSDPGNAGTIMRSAEAAGACAVVVCRSAVDPFSPKVVRSSAGSMFHVPILEAEPDRLSALGLTVIGTSSHQGRPFTDGGLDRPCAIVLGNEAHGIPHDVHIDEWVSVPHRGRAESLNVAMAATLLSFEAARHRARQPGDR
jgi:RNA methyltransferase, TrmH family